MSRFSGQLAFNGTQIDPSNIVSVLGEPYWLDRDDSESVYIYEYVTHEVQVEQSLDGVNQYIGVTTMPLMADPTQRAAYGVDKAWPPS